MCKNIQLRFCRFSMELKFYRSKRANDLFNEYIALRVSNYLKFPFLPYFVKYAVEAHISILRRATNFPNNS